MGRKTWDSLPPRFRPLPGRRNVVVTRDPLWAAEGAERAGSITEALERATEPSAPDAPATAWVIGGGEIYRAALEHATTLSVTEVDAPVRGDTYARPLTRCGRSPRTRAGRPPPPVFAIASADTTGNRRIAAGSITGIPSWSIRRLLTLKTHWSDSGYGLLLTSNASWHYGAGRTTLDKPFSRRKPW
nr:dihydrofolate reductase [Streptomyces alboflavus]